MIAMADKNNISVIIPVYNSEKILPSLLMRLANVLPKIAREFEVILVNDCSRDNSWRVIESLVQRYTWVQAINFMRNYGQHNALLCGIRQARYEVCVTMDDDLQHPPEEIHKLLYKLTDEYDVVYGVPEHEQHGLWRDMASKITKIALKSSMGVDVARSVSAFRVFRTILRDAFAQYNGSFVLIDVLLTWGTTRFCAVSVHHAPRAEGQSNYTFPSLIKHALNMITGFSILPLQVSSIIGFIFTLFGATILFYVILRYILFGAVVPGFSFLASSIAIFSGAQLVALGIIGEYLARVHFRTMDKTVYSIRNVIGGQDENSSFMCDSARSSFLANSE